MEKGIGGRIGGALDLELFVRIQAAPASPGPAAASGGFFLLLGADGGKSVNPFQTGASK